MIDKESSSVHFLLPDKKEESSKLILSAADIQDIKSGKRKLTIEEQVKYVRSLILESPEWKTFVSEAHAFLGDKT